MTPQSRMAPKVELGVRSDAISIVGNGVHGAVPAQVVMVEHLGGSSLLYVDGLDQLLPWERQTNRGIAPARPVETWRSECSPGVAAERPLLGRCEVASKADLRRNPVVRNNRPTDCFQQRGIGAEADENRPGGGVSAKGSRFVV